MGATVALDRKPVTSGRHQPVVCVLAHDVAVEGTVATAALESTLEGRPLVVVRLCVTPRLTLDAALPAVVRRRHDTFDRAVARHLDALGVTPGARVQDLSVRTVRSRGSAPGVWRKVVASARRNGAAVLVVPEGLVPGGVPSGRQATEVEGLRVVVVPTSSEVTS